MKLANRSALSMVSVMLAAGCVQETAPTVAYFRAHEDERKAQLARCASDPGSLANSPGCVNAREAADLERRDSLRDLPSMGLPREPRSSPPEEDKAR
jgi:hypothetical protein